MTEDAAMRVVLDTNVLVAALRSRRGASFALVSCIPSPAFVPCLSVALYAEWQAVLTRPEHVPVGLTPADMRGFLSYLAARSHLQPIYFRWRPFLADPADDMVLELAVAAGARHIVTHNAQHFRGADALGVEVTRPRAFLDLVRELS